MDTLRKLKKSWCGFKGLSAIVCLLVLFCSGEVAAAAGGAVLVTASAVRVENNHAVDVTLSVKASENTTIHSAGFLLRWDASVFALDAASSGEIDDNDPHQTSYLSGDNGIEINNENNRILHDWSVNDNDVMELRLSNDDAGEDQLFGVSNQAYINYTRVGSLTLRRLNTVELFKVTLIAKPDVSIDVSDISAMMIAVSDDRGNSHEDYNQDNVAVTFSNQNSSLSAMPGDVSPMNAPDGTVNINDAVEVLRMVLGIRTDKPMTANVSPYGNPDDQVNVNDAVVILQYVLGIVGEITVDGYGVHLF